MTDLVCEVASLMKDRPQHIRGRLQQISEDFVHVEPKQFSDAIDIVARTPGSPSSAARNDLTFYSSVKSIMCHYREIWQCIDTTGDNYRLHNLHFHLLQHDGPDDPTKELLAFHWHRTTTTTSGAGDYNHRPHLHFAVAPDPLPKAHLVVTLGVSISDQSTVKYLDELLDEAVGMVASEVLKLYV